MANRTPRRKKFEVIAALPTDVTNYLYTNHAQRVGAAPNAGTLISIPWVPVTGVHLPARGRGKKPLMNATAS